MRERIRSHLSYANVMATVAVFLVLSGGTAVALNGSNTVQSDDIGPGAQVKALDIAGNSVTSSKVVDENLTGADIKNQSGVDTCTHGTVRFGELCVGVANEHNFWHEAVNLCANLNLRLPSLGEAHVLAHAFDLPNVDQDEFFWTEDVYVTGNTQVAFAVNDSGIRTLDATGTTPNETVCVTTPTN